MKKYLLIALISFTSMLLSSCSESKDVKKEISASKPINEVKKIDTPKTSEGSHNVKYIESDAQFEEVLAKSDSVLLVFDLYADWCNPCKILSPILEEISIESAGKAEIYKVNVDKLPNISRAFGVKSIPLVVYIKNKKGVTGLVGVQPKKAYIDAIDKFAF